MMLTIACFTTEEEFTTPMMGKKFCCEAGGGVLTFPFVFPVKKF